MDIQAVIRDEMLLPRLRRNGVLVIYDPAQRYRNLCLDLASETLRVVDATESSIESRETAMQTLHEPGHPHTPLTGLLVYVPARCHSPMKRSSRTPLPSMLCAAACFPKAMGMNT